MRRYAWGSAYKGHIKTDCQQFHPFKSTKECSSWHMQPLLALCHVCASPQKLSVTCQNQSENPMLFCSDVQVWTAWHQISGSVCQVPYENRCPHYSPASIQKSASYLSDPYLAIVRLIKESKQQTLQTVNCISRLFCSITYLYTQRVSIILDFLTHCSFPSSPLHSNELTI